jgi:tRNA-2-methylthio-N6-dimethylallyladenosine synthase
MNQKMQKNKLLYIVTFGCQMNDNDTERMKGLLSKVGYQDTDSPDGADLIILNTCSVRDKAEQKLYSAVGRFKKQKQAKPSLIICIAGCVAEQQGEELIKRIEHLDMVVGTNNVHKLPALIKEFEEQKNRSKNSIVATGFTDKIEGDEYGYLADSSTSMPAKTSASVSIMRGCDNYCSYCIVPYVRGPEVSRSPDDIINEVQSLANSGVREITLVGQNVNSYNPLLTDETDDECSFTSLLKKVAGISKIERIRFVTSHPKDITDELIALFGSEPKLARHLHLPLQSGSDKVLGLMKRGYSVAEYTEKLERIKTLYPDMSITTDIIVGFPGESADDFNATMDILDKINFDNIFSFMYSKRPGTEAESFSNQLPLEIKQERLQRLQAAQKDIAAKKSASLVGTKMPVLIEGRSKNSDDELTGRTSCNRVVNFRASKDSSPIGLEGSVMNVLITDAYANSLKGSLQTERSV